MKDSQDFYLILLFYILFYVVFLVDYYDYSTILKHTFHSFLKMFQTMINSIRKDVILVEN